MRLCLKLSQEEMRCVTMTLCYQFSCRIHLFRSRLDILCTSQLFFLEYCLTPRIWPALVHLISPYNFTSDSSIWVKRRKEMIIKLVIVKHILLASIIGSVWQIVSRVCILMLKYRGLILAASTQFSGHLEAAGNPLRCFRSLINRTKQLS